ncbi:MAG: serine protease [Leptospiraceae bacterium]|nr:MAG: serine protease [Leptospiraceae bacterium]
MKINIKILILGFFIILFSLSAQQKDLNKELFIYKIIINDAITPASMEKLIKAIEKANQDKANALLVQLDTPGGLMSSMDEMIKAIMNSKVPVITYVAPPGASCGSAGVFILLSSHIAAMAPATNIGSATPITMNGNKENDNKKESPDQKALREKILNHAKAKIKAIADYYGRNSNFAIKTVTEAANIPSTEAYKIKLIDEIAISEKELLNKIDGKIIKTIHGEHVLQTKNVKIIELKDDLRNKILSIIANPNIAYLLIMIGMAGIMIEIQYPGLIFPGVIGAICLVLGLYGLQTLPVDYTGFLLIFLGIIFLILELKITSYGLLGIAGIISIVLGIIWIADSMKEIEETSIMFMITITFFILILFFIILRKVIQANKNKIVSSDQSLFYEIGDAITDINQENGKIFIHGEYWNAISDTFIPKGSKVQPIERNGMILKVKKVDEDNISIN